jgi:hypothetical protein
MAYRDDRQALSLQVADLERENEELKEEVAQLKAKAKQDRTQERENRRVRAFQSCAICGGQLLPVAVFAGRDHGKPIPLSMSTARFGAPDGGFSRSAPLKSKVCSSCGFIHSFIDIAAPEAVDVTGSFTEIELDVASDPDPPTDESSS